MFTVDVKQQYNNNNLGTRFRITDEASVAKLDVESTIRQRCFNVMALNNADSLLFQCYVTTVESKYGPYKQICC